MNLLRSHNIILTIRKLVTLRVFYSWVSDMIIYLLNFLLMLMYLFIYRIFIKKKYNYENRFLILCFLQFLCISSLRASSVGSDTIVYINRFLSSIDKPIQVNAEIGFVLFRELISSITDSPQAFLFCAAAITLYSFYKFILNNSPDKILSCYLFVSMGYFGLSMNAMRQILAMAIIIHSIEFIKEKQLLKFICFTAAAMLFHKTAIVFLIIYPLSHVSIKKEILIAGSSIIAIPIVGLPLAGIISNVIGFGGYWYYITQTTKFNSIIILSMICVYIAAIIFRKTILEKDQHSIIYFNMIAVSIVAQACGTYFSMASRLAFYFYVFAIIFIPKILCSVHNNLFRWLGYFIIIALTTLQFILTALWGDVNIYPYSFFWS